MQRNDRLAIIGAGCAGLSLAAGLARQGFDLNAVALYERRTEYQQDRSWCYWGVEEHPWQELEFRRWWRWRLCYQGREVVVESRRYPYCLLPAGEFYHAALGIVRGTAGVRLELGTGVERIDPLATGHSLLLSCGTEAHAERVVDTRPPPALMSRRYPALLQHFLGQYIYTSEEVFDCDTVTLMDFDLDQSRGIHFVYMLPLQPNLAYVADTFFAHEPLDATIYRATLREWLRLRHGVVRFTVESEEQGVIPMLTAPTRLCHAGVRRLGLAGGAAKPSSGYAFLAIQRQTEEYLRRLATEGLGAQPPRPRSLGLEWLDRIFLCQMLDYPGAVPELMLRLFERCEGDALVRFLSDCPSAQDVWQVVRALPPLGLSLTALRRVNRWLS